MLACWYTARSFSSFGIMLNGMFENSLTCVFASYSIILGAGSCIASVVVTILFHPVPSSSHRLNRLISLESFSFLDFGGLSMILFISTSGVPGFVISILLSKISTVVPTLVVLNCWCTHHLMHLCLQVMVKRHET